MKDGVTFILAVVLLLPQPYRGDAVFHCESKSTLFGLPNEYTTKNQWLSYIYNTVPEQYNANIQVCAAHFTEDCFLILGESNVSLESEHYEWLHCKKKKKVGQT